jgi:hypothetical protein
MRWPCPETLGYPMPLTPVSVGDLRTDFQLYPTGRVRFNRINDMPY